MIATEPTAPAGRGELAPGRAAKPPLGPHTLLILFVVNALILLAVQLAPELFGAGKDLDYPLWRWAGRQVLTGGDLYSLAGRTTFDFLYPPFAAVMLAPFSLFGPAFSILCIVLVTLASWWAAATLSDRLSGYNGPKAWWVVALPSFLLLPIIYETFNLGQPNLMLLALMLAGLALLQSERPWSAGALFALAASLKAFPIAVLPYLLWRRRWRAAAAMAIGLGVFLLIVPAPFRGFERNLQEVKTWAQGMVLSANQDGFGQRPQQNWGWKNNSLIAITHRLLRPVSAEQIEQDAKPLYVNVLNLSYRQTNLALLAIAGLIGVGFCCVIPRERRRSPRSDASEFGLLLWLITIASPLARDYYFIWMLFPITVLVYDATLEPSARVRRITWGLLAVAAVLFSIGLAFGREHWPQALGNWFWASAVVAGGLVWRLRRAVPASAYDDAPAPSPALAG
jgi:hypothetical protein